MLTFTYIIYWHDFTFQFLPTQVYLLTNFNEWNLELHKAWEVNDSRRSAPLIVSEDHFL